MKEDKITAENLEHAKSLADKIKDRQDRRDKAKSNIIQLKKKNPDGTVDLTMDFTLDEQVKKMKEKKVKKKVKEAIITAQEQKEKKEQEKKTKWKKMKVEDMKKECFSIIYYSLFVEKSYK